MERVFLLLGSNVNPQENIACATELLHKQFQVIQRSSLYQTAAWGNTDQPDFLNQVIELSVTLSAENLLSETQSIERALGREREIKWGPRKIDIDILFYGNHIIHTPALTIPHPEIAHRKFTLIPLQEVAPNFMHPVLNKNITQLLLDCVDLLEVKKL